MVAFYYLTNTSISAMTPGLISIGVMVKAMDCRIVVSDFEFQSRYYVHFQTNTLGKGRNLLILPAYGLNNITAVYLEGCLWH